MNRSTPNEEREWQAALAEQSAAKRVEEAEARANAYRHALMNIQDESVREALEALRELSQGAE